MVKAIETNKVNPGIMRPMYPEQGHPRERVSMASKYSMRVMEMNMTVVTIAANLKAFHNK